jgi:3-dehydroquinate synthase
MIPHKIRVELGERSYDVVVGSGTLENFGSLLGQEGISGRVVVITDRNVGGRYLGRLRRHLSENGFDVLSIVIPPGESKKSLKTAQQIYSRMLEERIGRTSTVIALGGGVIGDLAGFVAATYHRGIGHVHVPTTLLAQVDSSIGGKTGVNHSLGKNMVGAFHQPKVVVTDPAVLRTLPKREILSGLGEIVKYGVILDESLFSFLERGWHDVAALETQAIRHVVYQCAELKASLVSRDEEEQSERVILNCGHTIGHALEAWGNFRMYKHGEAVLMGLVAESHIASQMGLLDRVAWDRILRLIRQFPLSHFRVPARAGEVVSWIGRDKKSRNGKNRFVLPSRIGGTVVTQDVPAILIRDAVRFLSTLGFGQR